MRKNEIDIITLGCSKNLVDAERLMRQLELAGYKCVHDSADPKGEIAIINTCGFIGDAKEESIDVILQFAAKKTKGKLHKLYVMGCLSQRYREELPVEIPEVDKWFGKFDYLGIVEEVKGERSKVKGEEVRRLNCLQQFRRIIAGSAPGVRAEFDDRLASKEKGTADQRRWRRSDE